MTAAHLASTTASSLSLGHVLAVFLQVDFGQKQAVPVSGMPFVCEQFARLQPVPVRDTDNCELLARLQPGSILELLTIAGRLPT
jgi:hypothetical protein